MIVNGQVTGAEVRSDTLVLEDGIIRFAGPRELLPGEIADRADIEVDAREGWLLPDLSTSMSMAAAVTILSASIEENG